MSQDDGGILSDQIGIPIPAKLHFGYCSTPLNHLIEYLKQESNTQLLARAAGLHMYSAESTKDGSQQFVVSTESPSGDTQQANKLFAELAAIALPERPADRLRWISERLERGDYDRTGLPGQREAFSKMRKLLAQGPSRINIGGEDVPWGESLTKAECRPGRPAPRPVPLELIGQEVQLVGDNNQRYHLENHAEVPEMERGEIVFMEITWEEKAHFVGPEAFVRQGSLIFPDSVDLED